MIEVNKTKLRLKEPPDYHLAVRQYKLYPNLFTLHYTKLRPPTHNYLALALLHTETLLRVKPG